VNPHFGHLYKRPNLRHFPSLLIWISPQLGQRNFVDSPAGGIGLPQLVQVTKDSFSVIFYISCGLNCKGSLYLLCLQLHDNLLVLRHFSPKRQNLTTNLIYIKMFYATQAYFLTKEGTYSFLELNFRVL
jgi:hypothetical protein